MGERENESAEVTIVYRLKLAAVMLLAASAAIALRVSVSVCVWVGVRERERESGNEFYYLSYVCVCVCVRACIACVVSHEKRGTGHCIFRAQTGNELRVSLDSISINCSIVRLFDSITRSSVRRARFTEEVYGSNERTRLLALLYILIEMAKRRAHTHTERDGRTHTHIHTYTESHMQSSLFVRLFELREIFARRSTALGTRQQTERVCMI